MPRTNFKTKKSQSSFKNYTQNDLERALNEVKTTGISVYRASVLFKIPYSTLNDHTNNPNLTVRVARGTSPWLPKEYEELLVDILCKLAD